MTSHARGIAEMVVAGIESLPGPEWIIAEDRIPLNVNETSREALFSVSNGYFAGRACFPFSPRGTRGTYVNGLYASGPAELYWVPSPGDSWDTERFPTIESIHAHGREWALAASPNIFHTSAAAVKQGSWSRALDLRNGVLHITGNVEIDGAACAVYCMRFVSKLAPACAFERIVITPANQDAALDLFLGLDDSIVNVRWEDRRFDLWKSREFRDAGGDTVAWLGRTSGKDMKLAIAMRCSIVQGNGFAEFSPRRDGYTIHGTGKMTIDRCVALCSSRIEADPFDAALERCAEISASPCDAHLRTQARAWKEIWDVADIRVDGPVADQQALRYSIYQVMAAALDTDRISLGLNSLSDEGYHGLVFWDMDLYMLPFITRTLPDRARQHLLFRHRGLAAARAKARANGYRGAMYPWETAPTGEEGISPWIMLNRTQVHVVGAVAWAVVDYCTWTGDRDFMRTCGWEILAETARFWASKVSHDGRIPFVCGPDEFNQVVDNNAYTNHIARLNLLWAAEHCMGMVPETEIGEWRRIAGLIREKTPRADGVIEQFDGFFALPQEKQISKQADVVAMAMVDRGYFSGRILKANYRYYLSRCRHLSSLSEVTYAMCATRLGEIEEAYRWFQVSANMDLHDLHQCVDRTGHHAACCALVARLVTEGFCGMRLTPDGRLSFRARLPGAWKSVAFHVVHNGRKHDLHLANGETQVLR